MISDEAKSARLTISSLGDSRRVSVAGTLDMATKDLMAASLRPLLAAGHDVHLDLSRLTFADVSGVTVLAILAQRLPAGSRLILERPPRQLRRIVNLFWPGLHCIELVTGNQRPWR